MSVKELDFTSCYRAVVARDARFDGRFYTAVTSTRIYCRPICPARTPSSRNVRFYRHAASAEAAGFRPCRRCRPELSPGDPGWDHRGDLVGRALRLIDEGVADDDGVTGLAGRLHITGRHLHRLFTTEIGAGPLAVARTKRLLLAKQLLTETRLPITDVAFAAGFGSVRQFNAVMKETYGFPPGELRDATGRGAAGDALTLRLHRREPYDAGTLIRFLRARAIPGLEHVDGTSYRRAVPGGTVTLTPRPDHVRLDVDIDDTRRLAWIVARCRRLFDLDADPEAISAALGETSLAPLVAARPGLRVPGAWDGFEVAVRAVVGQQISVAGARTILGRVAARAGRPIGGEEPAHLFPTAAELAEADLGGLGLTGRRVATLKALAAKVAGGEIDLDGAQEPAEVVARLMEIPGIGPWTGSYVALRALRDPDAWPAGDLGLRRAMACLGIPDNHIERWRPWRAYAALHLWSSE
ncbi:AraC family transcriptional regulator of adaptative response / DNA-3-methyladenine glycosylase II [Streptosporangium becharense]|uniref:DNA-3-methyladenine glycosylase II n=1 Tax=Streptosporangium becharense TaxID=1816182 RepID=A0A7W9MGI2_9ACTN|nr:AlkA N-terminal domain-containing protein [Streptosporangium becharense]MBB2909641.1 AraC family transcriptional regulator of adaptative response / DNA-3-methyladenine glycosylase II [Streptosporangium becharense]MBB5819403.1 AraC family transcriptional regulator of adaptative response / DNA-3-methyladenine glycosylase II [Streptosporangium becharense]